MHRRGPTLLRVTAAAAVAEAHAQLHGRRVERHHGVAPHQLLHQRRGHLPNKTEPRQNICPQPKEARAPW
jgi:hypothetical protein